MQAVAHYLDIQAPESHLELLEAGANTDSIPGGPAASHVAAKENDSEVSGQSLEGQIQK